MYRRTTRAFPTALSLIIEEDPTRHSRVFVDCARKLKFKITSCHTGAYKETLSYVVLINTINKVEKPATGTGAGWSLRVAFTKIPKLYQYVKHQNIEIAFGNQ